VEIDEPPECQSWEQLLALKFQAVLGFFVIYTKAAEPHAT
jgi:hypothetical protein